MARITVLSILTCSLSMVLSAEDDNVFSKEDTLKSIKLHQQETPYRDLPGQKLAAKVTPQNSQARQVLINNIYYGFLDKDYLKSIPLVELFRRPINADMQHKELGAYIILSYVHQIPLPEKLVSILKQKASQNESDAQFILGWMHAKGYGVPSKNRGKNIKEAIEWYTKAAEQGHPVAQNNLGSLYAKGFGELSDNQTENDKIAVKWYAKSAKQDNPKGLFNLARMYELGRGVPPSRESENIVTAFKLFAKAAKIGSGEGKKRLKDLLVHFPLKSSLVELSPLMSNTVCDNLINLNEFYSYLAAAARATGFDQNIFAGNNTIYQAADKAEKFLTVYRELSEHLLDPLFMIQYTFPCSSELLPAPLMDFLPNDATPYISFGGPSIRLPSDIQLEKSLRAILKTMTQMAKFIDKVEMKKFKKLLPTLTEFEDHLSSHIKALWIKIKSHLVQGNEKNQGFNDYLAYARKELQEKSQEVEEDIAFVSNLNERLINLIRETAPYRNYLFETKVLN